MCLHKILGSSESVESPSGFSSYFFFPVDHLFFCFEFFPNLKKNKKQRVCEDLKSFFLGGGVLLLKNSGSLSHTTLQLVYVCKCVKIPNKIAQLLKRRQNKATHFFLSMEQKVMQWSSWKRRCRYPKSGASPVDILQGDDGDRSNLRSARLKFLQVLQDCPQPGINFPAQRVDAGLCCVLRNRSKLR